MSVIHYTSNGRTFDEPTLGTYGAIERSVFPLWRNLQTEEPDLQAILQKHYNILSGENTPSPYDGLKQSMRDIYNQCSSGGNIPDVIVTSRGNHGALVAAAWEKYVGSQPVDNIFDRNYFKDFESPVVYLDLMDIPEQPTIGLIG